ncbi:MAG TPA: VWA domain-containing protein [Phycisphaerae bacterium]|nr:VWA domain-containing protein [Phycisphaerae bacterium]HNU46062.1 VWA domain-containing protein [Phycisphaerae bacterium]
MSDVLLQSVPMLHPALATFGLAAAAIPVLIHLISRRRYRRVPWAAMSFLLAVHRRSARRVFLEQWLVLLLRVLALALLGLALARPYFSSAWATALTAGSVQRIILLDNSGSMNARAAGQPTRFERAQAVARRLVDSFPPRDPISVITVAAPARAHLADPVLERRLVRERLAAVSPTANVTDFVGALTLARDLVREGQHVRGNRTVYVISDFSAPYWPGPADDAPAAPAVLAAKALTAEAALTLVRVAPGDEGNVAVTNLAPEASLIGLQMPVRFTVTVANYGDTPRRDLAVQLRRGEQILRREPLPPVPAGGQVQASLATAFATPGTPVLEARVVADAADALPEDDARYVSVEVRSAAPVLLVDGRPGRTRLDGQVGYLATALAPRLDPHDTTVLEPKVVTEVELEAEPLPAYDVVVLGNVERLSARQWQYLERYVAEGGGLLIFAGDLLNTEDYNRNGHRGGAGPLPGRFGGPALPPGQVEAFTQFDVRSLTHPGVVEFAQVPDSGLFLAQVRQYLTFTPDLPRAEVLMRYTDGAPALILNGYGAGRVLVCTTTANLDWTNLPAKGDFVSLMANLVTTLAPPRGEQRNLLIGQTLQAPLAPSQTALPLRLRLPEGNWTEGKLVPAGAGLAFQYGPLEDRGTYVLSVGADNVNFVANGESMESDTRTCAGAALRALLGPSVPVLNDDEAARQGVPGGTGAARELAVPLLAILLLALLAESFAAMWLGSRREQA